CGAGVVVMEPSTSLAVVPAKAGTHIPEAVVMGPQRKRVYARLRRAMRGDDSMYFRRTRSPLSSSPFKCVSRRRRATRHDHLHVQSLGSGVRAISHQPVGRPRQGGGLRRGKEGRAGGAAQHAARARHVSAGAAGWRGDPARRYTPPPATPPPPPRVVPTP